MYKTYHVILCFILYALNFFNMFCSSLIKMLRIYITKKLKLEKTQKILYSNKHFIKKKDFNCYSS